MQFAPIWCDMNIRAFYWCVYESGLHTIPPHEPYGTMPEPDFLHGTVAANSFFVTFLGADPYKL
jgi:hypothetical protein